VEQSRERALWLKVTKAPPKRPSLCVRICSHVRAYRRASRPAFAHSSDGRGSDSSGDSDSGDPPGPSHHFALLNPFQFFYSKPNSFSLRPWRFFCRLGCWCMPRCKCAVRRWRHES
jgi:hypothetical protein